MSEYIKRWTSKRKSDIYSFEIFKSLILSDSGPSGNMILKQKQNKNIHLKIYEKNIGDFVL